MCFGRFLPTPANDDRFVSTQAELARPVLTHRLLQRGPTRRNG